MTEAVVEKSPQEHFNELRQWVTEHCHTGHPVRQSAYLMSLTAVVHRLMKIGPDETLNHLTARDLLNMLIYVNGEMAEWLMRSAFTRALIDDDSEIFDLFAHRPFIGESTAWYWKLVQGILGQSPDPNADTEWLQGLPPEEKALAHLMIARVFPDTAHIDWLHDVPENCPRIAYKLAGIIAQRPGYQHAIENWLRDRPKVRNEEFN